MSSIHNNSNSSRPSTAVVDTFDTISSAILQKQQELTHLNDYRFKSLENTILEKNKQIEKERQQFKQLKTDFDYNLKLIEGRDEELKQFDQKFIELRHEMKEKDELISELQAQMATIQSVLKQEQAKNNEEQIFYQERIQELKHEIEQHKFNNEDRVRTTVTEYESMIRNLKRQLNEKIEDMDRTKREMEQEFQSSLLQKEQQDRSNTTVISDQRAQINRLQKELEHQSMKYSNQIEAIETERELLKRRIEELKREYQEHVKEQETVHTRQQKELAQTYESRINSLSSELKVLQGSNKQSKELSKLYQMECEEQLRQKEQEIESIRQQVEEKWSIKAKEFEQLQSNEWNLNLELKNEKEKNSTLRKQLEDRKEELQQYKDQMKRLIDKEAQMKKEMLSLQLQYERDTEQKHEEINRKNEGIVRSLKKSLENAQSELQDKQKHILELKAQLKQKTVQAQRNAIASELRGSIQREKMEKDIDMEFGLESIRSVSPVDSIHMDFDFDASVPKSQSRIIRTSQSSQGLGSLKEYNSMRDERDELKIQVEKLETQKSQIKEVISNMKSDLEDYQNIKDALAEAELELQQNQIRIKQLESQVHTLQSTNVDTNMIKQLYEQISTLTEKVERKEDSGGVSATEQVTRLNTLMTDLRMDLEEQREQLLQSQAKMETLTKENASLKLKLKEAAKELKNVIKEREKLIDISNMLKAQITRMKEQYQDSGSKKQHFGERPEETIQQYADKIHKLELRMNELNTNNEALREELTKVKVKNKQLQIQRAMDSDDQTARISSLRDSIQQLTNSNRLAEVVVGEVDDDDPHLINHHRKTTDHSRAKQKLEEVRSSLSLSARGAPMSSRSTSTTKEVPGSRASKSLRSLQKKRAEIVPKRKAVREVY